MICFTYRITGRGWSEATLTAGDQTVELTASYLDDALWELTRRVRTLVEGVEQARCDWQEEPGSYRWLFARQGERLTIKILWFEETFSRADDERGKLLFEVECRLADFAGQLKSQLQYLLTEMGASRYEAEWGREFPMSEYERLSQAIKQRHTSRSQDAPL